MSVILYSEDELNEIYSALVLRRQQLAVSIDELIALFRAIRAANAEAYRRRYGEQVSGEYSPSVRTTHGMPDGKLFAALGLLENNSRPYLAEEHIALLRSLQLCIADDHFQREHNS